MSVLFLVLSLSLSFENSSISEVDQPDEAFIHVKGGSFSMGCSGGAGDCRPDNRAVHTVTVSDFYMGKYEITQQEYEQVMGTNPSHFSECEDCPVENVCWYDAVAFCNKKSQLDGLTPYYTIDKETVDRRNLNTYDDMLWTVTINPTANGYRLPTEAEWEFVARGGKQDVEGPLAGSGEEEQLGWLKVNSNDATHPVGQKLANELGVYDMTGNVEEWCWDWHASYTKKSQVNPIGPKKGSERMLRGGSWITSGNTARVFHRSISFAQGRSWSIGFRIARSVQ